GGWRAAAQSTSTSARPPRERRPFHDGHPLEAGYNFFRGGLMSQLRTRLKRRPFVPRLGGLEGRDVPCTIVYGQGLLGGTDIFENDLLIRGDRQKEAIVLNDDGTSTGVVVPSNRMTACPANHPLTAIP